MIASGKVTEQAENRWTEIVERFRAACVLHRENRETESKRIIKEELPELIKAWIKLLPTALKDDAKADLRDMFTREQSLVDQGMRLQNVFKETLVKRIIPQVEEQVAAKYRALYLKEQKKRAAEIEAARKRPWVRTGNAANAANGRERVPLDNVGGMIDASQRDESELLSRSMLSLEEIVSTLNKAKIGAILADA